MPQDYSSTTADMSSLQVISSCFGPLMFSEETGVVFLVGYVSQSIYQILFLVHNYTLYSS